MKKKKIVKVFAFLLLCCTIINIDSNISQAKEDEIIIILPDEEPENNTTNNNSQPYVPIISTPTAVPTQAPVAPKKSTTKKATATPTPTVEPTQTPTPEPTKEIVSAEEPLKLSEAEDLEKIPNYLLDSKWSSDNNTLTREIVIGEGTTRLEVFYSKEGPAPVLKFKDAAKKSLNVAEIATIQSENKVEGYEDILYDIIYISNPENPGTWKMTITKTDNLKELIIVNSNVPNGWETGDIGIYKTKVKNVECWYLDDKSKYKATDIEKIIEEEETKINYNPTQIPEEVIEEPEVNYGKVIVLLVGVIVIGIIGFFAHKSYKEKLADKLEREEGARRRGQKTTYTEEEDYNRLNAELNLRDDEYTDDDYSDADYSDDAYSDDEYSDAGYSSDDYSDNGYLSNNHSDNAYSDAGYSSDDYSDNGYLSNNYSDNAYSDAGYSSNDYSNNNYLDDNYLEDEFLGDDSNGSGNSDYADNIDETLSETLNDYLEDDSSYLGHGNTSRLVNKRYNNYSHNMEDELSAFSNDYLEDDDEDTNEIIGKSGVEQQTTEIQANKATETKKDKVPPAFVKKNKNNRFV